MRSEGTLPDCLSKLWFPFFGFLYIFSKWSFMPYIFFSLCFLFSPYGISVFLSFLKPNFLFIIFSYWISGIKSGWIGSLFKKKKQIQHWELRLNWESTLICAAHLSGHSNLILFWEHNSGCYPNLSPGLKLLFFFSNKCVLILEKNLRIWNFIVWLFWGFMVSLRKSFLQYSLDVNIWSYKPNSWM